MLGHKTVFSSLVVFVLASATSAFAQLPEETRFGPLTIGARGGFTMSWMSFTEDDLRLSIIDEGTGQTIAEILQTDSRRFGGAGGIDIAYDVSPRWAVEARVLYATQGSTVRGSEALSLPDLPGEVVLATTTSSFRTGYVNVPVLVRASFGSAQSHFYAGAGATFGFLVRAKLHEMTRFTLQGSAEEFTLNAVTDIKDDMQGSSTSASFLGGWEHGGRRMRGFFELGYDLGLTNLFKDEVGFSDVKHRGFTFMAGLGF